MTNTDDSRIRELIGRAGDQAPALPVMEELEARAALVEPHQPDRFPKRLAFTAAVIIIALGIGLAWQTQRDDASDVVAADERAAATDETASAWPDDAWPILPDEAGLEMAFARQDSPGLRVVHYTTRTGSGVWLVVEEPQPDDDRQQPGDEPDNPGGTAVDIAGLEGVLEIWGEGDDPLVRVRWERDGLRFFVDAEDMLAQEVVQLAQSITPVAASELPVSVTSTSQGDDHERQTVATVQADGEAHTLTATTPDGRAFFLSHEPNGEAEGPPLQLAGDDLLQVRLSLSAQNRLLLAGIVSQTVDGLALRMTDNSTQTVEIQGRDLGYDVAFFLTSVGDLSQTEQLEAVEAYDVTGKVIDTEVIFE